MSNVIELGRYGDSTNREIIFLDNGTSIIDTKLLKELIHGICKEDIVFLRDWLYQCNEARKIKNDK